MFQTPSLIIWSLCVFLAAGHVNWVNTKSVPSWQHNLQAVWNSNWVKVAILLEFESIKRISVKRIRIKTVLKVWTYRLNTNCPNLTFFFKLISYMYVYTFTVTNLLKPKLYRWLRLFALSNWQPGHLQFPWQIRLSSWSKFRRVIELDSSQN